MVVGMLVAYVVVSLLYIHGLHKRLKSYEHIWEQIESVADRNQDGTFTIQVQHLEDAHPSNEAHEIVDDSCIRLRDVMAELETDDSPPRAA